MAFAFQSGTLGDEADSRVAKEFISVPVSDAAIKVTPITFTAERLVTPATDRVFHAVNPVKSGKRPGEGKLLPRVNRVMQSLWAKLFYALSGVGAGAFVVYEAIHFFF